MKKRNFMLLAVFFIAFKLFASDNFPDGTPIPDWFKQILPTNLSALGKQYRITDYGVVNDSTIIQTEAIQSIINQVAKEGGVIIIPKGTFLSGALFFKQGVHLYLEEEARLKGSDDISHFPIVETRIEGQCVKYFPALVNANGVDGFTISGRGTIDGNGLRYWKSFWLRRSVIPNCTNMDELRPRLLYISNASNVQISGVKFVNSPFWTTHFYKCLNVKLLNLHIYSPSKPVKAPSTDAVDIDVCTNFLIKNCYMSVNDDAIALKGGKGPWADKDTSNGINQNIIIEDCHYGYCHGALTCGSESIHNRNVILRRCVIDEADRLLWLKMRPDTPQLYEYIRIEDIKGYVKNFLYVHPWTQFYDLKDRKSIPVSYSRNVTMQNIELKCDVFFNVERAIVKEKGADFLDLMNEGKDIVNTEEQYELSDFTFKNLNITAKKGLLKRDMIENLKLENVMINHDCIR